MPAILPHRPSADGTNAAASVLSLFRALDTCSLPAPLGKKPFITSLHGWLEVYGQGHGLPSFECYKFCHEENAQQTLLPMHELM